MQHPPQYKNLSKKLFDYVPVESSWVFQDP